MSIYQIPTFSTRINNVVALFSSPTVSTSLVLLHHEKIWLSTLHTLSLTFANVFSMEGEEEDGWVLSESVNRLPNLRMRYSPVQKIWGNNCSTWNCSLGVCFTCAQQCLSVSKCQFCISSSSSSSGRSTTVKSGTC